MYSVLAMDYSSRIPIMKRRRSSEEPDECQPIAKRMNNIHLEGQNQPCSSNSQLHQSHSQTNGQLNGYSNSAFDHPTHCQASPQIHDTRHTPVPVSDYEAMDESSDIFCTTPMHPVQDGRGHSPSCHSNQLAHSQPQNVSLNNQNHHHFPHHVNTASSHDSNGNSFGPQQEDGNAIANMSYEPELSEVENPHYFHSNQLLFNIHVERLLREGRSLPEDYY